MPALLPRALPLLLGLGLLCLGCVSKPSASELPIRGVAECNLGELTPPGLLDVALAIDASRSTARPSGSDIDGDGEVGRSLNAVSSDPHDSVLAAQVAAARSLLTALEGRDVRFSIVSFSGRSHTPQFARPEGRVVNWEQARIRAGITDDREVLERALEQVMAHGGEGRTDFAAGMSVAIRTLLEAPEPGDARGRLVLFLADSSTTIVPKVNPAQKPGLSGGVHHRDPLMKQEALRAIRHGTPIHTFALIRAADDPLPHALKQIAGATGGEFRGVDDVSRLHCALLETVGRARPAVARP